VTSPLRSSTAKFENLAREAGERLDRAIAAVADTASEQANATRIPVLASVAVPIPAIRPLALLENSDDPIGGWWSQPGLEAAGVGIAVTYETSGAERLADLASELSERFAAGVADGRLPVAFFGAAFAAREAEGAWSDFPQAAAWVPETCVIRDQDGTWLAGATIVNPGEPPHAARDHLASLFGEAGAVLKRDERPKAARITSGDRTLSPGDPAWDSEVNQALDRIGNGSLQKVVLARVQHVDVEHISGWTLAQALSDRYPDAFLYGVRRGEATFVGASPELLVEQDEGEVRATPAAGTVAIDAPADGLDTE
jgi:isochorismate synthase EntC